MNFQKDIIKKTIYKTHDSKPKTIKMNEVFKTKNNKVIFKNKNSMNQVLNNTQKKEMDKLIKRHKY